MAIELTFVPEQIAQMLVALMQCLEDEGIISQSEVVQRMRYNIHEWDQILAHIKDKMEAEDE